MKQNRKSRSLFENQDANTAAAIFSVIMLIVGFAVAGLLFTFTQVLGGQTYNLVENDIDAISSYSDYNHTFKASNKSYVSVGHIDIKTGTLHIYNATKWADNTSQFSLNYTNGTVKLTTSAAYKKLNGTTMYVLYEYDDGLIRSAVKHGILSNFEAQQQIGGYMPIIALAIIITIIIGLIIGGIASRFMGPGAMGGYGGYPGGGQQIF